MEQFASFFVPVAALVLIFVLVAAERGGEFQGSAGELAGLGDEGSRGGRMERRVEAETVLGSDGESRVHSIWEFRELRKWAIRRLNPRWI